MEGEEGHSFHIKNSPPPFPRPRKGNQSPFLFQMIPFFSGCGIAPINVSTVTAQELRVFPNFLVLHQPMSTRVCVFIISNDWVC